MMKNRLIAIVVFNVLLVFVCTTALGKTPKEKKEAKLAAEVQTGIRRVGTGPDARVQIKLRDKTTLKGYIDEITDDYFVVIDDAGRATEVGYPQVRQVKGNNLSTGAKFAIATLIMGVIFAIAGAGGP